MKDSEARALVAELLHSQTTLVLATSGDHPIATPLFFAADAELNLYWLSSDDSRHSRNLLAGPSCSVTVFAPVDDWRAIRGVQMEGEAGRVADREPALALYRRRFSLGPELDGTIAASGVYAFRPRWLRYLDNAFGFGFKHEMHL
jgi:uncharacterized protein YhbP (UPF0306 family)